MLELRTRTTLRAIRLTVPTHEVEDFVAACLAAGWSAADTGERVATESGPDAEAVLDLAYPAPETRRFAWPDEVSR